MRSSARACDAHGTVDVWGALPDMVLGDRDRDGWGARRPRCQVANAPAKRPSRTWKGRTWRCRAGEKTISMHCPARNPNVIEVRGTPSGPLDLLIQEEAGLHITAKVQCSEHCGITGHAELTLRSDNRIALMVVFNDGTRMEAIFSAQPTVTTRRAIRIGFAKPAVKVSRSSTCAANGRATAEATTVHLAHWPRPVLPRSWFPIWADSRPVSTAPAMAPAVRNLDRSVLVGDQKHAAPMPPPIRPSLTVPRVPRATGATDRRSSAVCRLPSGAAAVRVEGFMQLHSHQRGRPRSIERIFGVPDVTPDEGRAARTADIAL